MLDLFLRCFVQIVILLFFMAVGFILVRSKLLPHGSHRFFSTLVTYVFLPGLNFYTFAVGLDFSDFSKHFSNLGLSLVLLVVLYIAGMFLAKLFAKNKGEHGIYHYTFVMPNQGFVGFPLILGIYGLEMLVDFQIFTLPFSIFVYTLGMMMLTSQKGIVWSRLFCPPVIGMIAGFIVSLTGVPLPDIVIDISQTAGNCMSTVAMILTGCVLAELPLKEMLGDIKIYIVSLIRLVGIPVVACTALYFLGATKDQIILTVLFLSLPCGLNTVVFPATYGGDSRPGAKLALVSSLMCLVTIPLIVSFFVTLVN